MAGLFENIRANTQVWLTEMNHMIFHLLTLSRDWQIRIWKLRRTFTAPSCQFLSVSTRKSRTSLRSSLQEQQRVLKKLRNLETLLKSTLNYSVARLQLLAQLLAISRLTMILTLSRGVFTIDCISKSWRRTTTVKISSPSRPTLLPSKLTW